MVFLKMQKTTATLQSPLFKPLTFPLNVLQTQRT